MPSGQSRVFFEESDKSTVTGKTQVRGQPRHALLARKLFDRLEYTPLLSPLLIIQACVPFKQTTDYFFAKAQLHRQVFQGRWQLGPSQRPQTTITRQGQKKSPLVRGLQLIEQQQYQMLSWRLLSIRGQINRAVLDLFAQLYLRGKQSRNPDQAAWRQQTQVLIQSHGHAAAVSVQNLPSGVADAYRNHAAPGAPRCLAHDVLSVRGKGHWRPTGALSC